MARYYTYYVMSGTNAPQSVGGGTQEPDFRFYFDVNYGQNIANNQSTITVNKYVEFAYSPSISHPIWANSFINGVERQSEKNMTASGWVGTDTATINHNADGTASFTFQGCGTSAYEVSYHGWRYTNYVTITLPTIPRTSTITNNTSSSSRKDFGTSVTFTISRASSFTHDLSYVVNGTTYSIGTGIETSKSYTFPTSLINSFPNTATPSITVTCVTKNGSTIVGSNTTTVYLNVPASYKPTCSLSISDSGTVPSGWGVWVRTKSKVSGSISASGSGSSTISSYNTTANGSTYTGSTFQTAELNNSGNQTITSYVKDSRGRQSTNASQTINVVDYWKPTISSYQVDRCLSDGTLDEDGTYGKVSCSYSISPVSNKNAKSLVVKYGSVTKTFALSSYDGSVTASTSQLFSGLTTNANHTFEFYIIDSFETSGIKFTFTMPPSYCLVSKLNGGKGISFGEIATEENFSVAMDAKFKRDMYLSNNLTVGNIIGKNLLSLTTPEGREITKNGITYTVNQNGSITLNGTATTTTDYVLFGAWNQTSQYITLDKDTTFSISSSDTGILMRAVYNGTSTFTETTTKITKSISSYVDITDVFIRVNTGVTLNNVTVYPMIEYGLTATDYMPFQPFIIESGSNSNGSWIKYSDGTMECRGFIGLGTKAYSTAYGYCYIAVSADTYTFPQEFSNTNISIVCSVYVQGGVGATATTQSVTTISFKAWLSYPKSTSLATSLAYTAKGRWK